MDVKTIVNTLSKDLIGVGAFMTLENYKASLNFTNQTFNNNCPSKMAKVTT